MGHRSTGFYLTKDTCMFVWLVFAHSTKLPPSLIYNCSPMTPMAKFLPHDVVLHGKMGFLFFIFNKGTWCW